MEAPKNSEPDNSASFPAPSPEELKNIEAVKQLLTPAEWAVVRRTAFTEEYAAQLALHNRTVSALAGTEEILTRFKSSVGRLYGHFNNVMLKWGVPALNSFGREARSVLPTEETPAPAPAVPAKTKGRTVYRFDPQAQSLVQVPNVPPLPPSAEVIEAAPKKRVRRASPSKFTRQDAPNPEEVAWRRKLTEKQLKLRPSTIGEIMSGLLVDGFPVSSPYYAELMKGRTPRLQTLISADLYLLVYNGALKRDEKNRYTWIGDRPDRYRSYKSHSKTKAKK